LPNTRPNKNKITEENTIVKVEILSYFWHAEQGLNKLTILNKYHLPLMTELSKRVAGATMFTKLDPKSGYHLIGIKK